jgi:hypothetical protein
MSMIHAGAVLSQPSDPVTRTTAVEDALKGRDAFYSLVEQRKRLIEELAAIVEREDTNRDCEGSLHLAIDLLGTMRASEAAQALSGRLSYVPRCGGMTDAPSEEHHVAAVALTRIGVSAIGPMAYKIAWSQDELERRIAAWVIMELDGKEQALFRLRRLADQNRFDNEAGKRFQTAISFVEQYHATLQPPVWIVPVCTAIGDGPRECVAEVSPPENGRTAYATVALSSTGPLRAKKIAEIALLNHHGELVHPPGDDEYLRTDSHIDVFHAEIEQQKYRPLTLKRPLGDEPQKFSVRVRITASEVDLEPIRVEFFD